MIPPNSSEQEKALIEATEFKIEPVRGFKFKLVPWLIYEYGLGEILAWVPKGVIQDGVRFQRIRGTAASLRMALKWVNIEDIKIEEEPPGKHFAEFQVGIDVVPNDFFVDNVVALAKLSAPARSRLMRMYNDRYDIRRFILDESEFGSFLSDNSGVKTDGPVLSFGRFNPFKAVVPNPNLKCSTIRLHHNSTLSNDIFRLDVSYIGEVHTNNYNGIYIREHIWHNRDHLPIQVFGKPLHFAKCLIVLSDSWALGDINACFAARLENEKGSAFILSRDILSEHVWEIEYQEILERFISSYSYNINLEVKINIQCYVAKEYWFSINTVYKLEQIHFKEHYKTTSYAGSLVWHQHRHLNRPWSDKEPIVSSIGEIKSQ